MCCHLFRSLPVVHIPFWVGHSLASSTILAAPEAQTSPTQGLCPDQEWNQGPFGSQASAQSTKATPAATPARTELLKNKLKKAHQLRSVRATWFLHGEAGPLLAPPVVGCLYRAFYQRCFILFNSCGEAWEPPF